METADSTACGGTEHAGATTALARYQYWTPAASAEDDAREKATATMTDAQAAPPAYHPHTTGTTATARVCFARFS